MILDPLEAFFFPENSLNPFVDEAWGAGCLLARARYDRTRMPRRLFDAIVATAHPTQLCIALYGYNGILHARIAPTMEAFRKFLDTSEACELFVLHDDSARWAVYAGDSVTALGAEEALRDAINGALRAEGNKGLRKMTLQAFPGWEVCDVWETFTTSEGSCDWILRPPPPSVPVRIS
jgi:hypothetical protein